jgi:pyruvate formate lyase activating enzyme
MDAYIHELVIENDCLIIKFSGCDYKCRYCNTPHLVEFQTGEQRDLREVMKEISESGASKVLFTGGEPLLQRQALLELLKHCKGQNMKTIIDTNASKPEAVESIIKSGLVDEFIIDVKAPLASFDKVTKAGTFFKPAAQLYEEFRTSLRILEKRQSEIALSFRSVVAPGLLYKKEDFLELGKLLKNFDAEWLLIPFQPAITLDQSLKGVAPPTRRFLETLAGFVKKEHPSLNVQVSS